MANEISAKNIGLYVNMGDDITPDWKLAVCSTSDGFSGSVDAVTTSTKCDDGWTSNLPGDGSWSFSHSALANKEPDVNQVSFKEMETLFLERAVKTWKLESTEPADDYYWEGKGFISSLSETADAGDYLAVDIEITGTGKPVNVASS